MGNLVEPAATRHQRIFSSTCVTSSCWGESKSILTGQDMVNIGSVHWFVDHDNPVWAQVRADAIRAALHKGQDYATALAGSIISVEHVADVGLLAGDTPDRMAHRPGGDAPLSL